MSELKNTGIIQSSSVGELLQLSDGSKGVQLVCHNLDLGNNLFSSSDNKLKFVYHSDECWCDFSLLNSCSRPASGYEILVIQQTDTTNVRTANNFTQYRGLQTVNPLTATGAQVNPSSGNITHYDSATYGGMYILNSSVWMCFANSSSSNWFGCAHHTLGGGTAGTDGYIPGYNGDKVYGWQNVYLRISDEQFKIYNELVSANKFIEY